MKKIILSIEGMTCSACSNGLEKYLNMIWIYSWWKSLSQIENLRIFFWIFPRKCYFYPKLHRFIKPCNSWNSKARRPRYNNLFWTQFNSSPSCLFKGKRNNKTNNCWARFFKQNNTKRHRETHNKRNLFNFNNSCFKRWWRRNRNWRNWKTL